MDMISEKKEKGSAILGIFHDKEVRDKVCDREIDVSNFSAS
jgi:alpha-D-ribose 1-methylphosphonate 5-triphosphate synthase subunit PhnL